MFLPESHSMVVLVVVRISNRCVKGLKHSRIEVTVYQFEPIYHTEIIAIVHCMCANHVVWDRGSDGLVDDFF